MPWKVNTLCGWLAANIFLVLAFATYYAVNGLFLSLYFTICYDFWAFRKQFESMCTELDEEQEKNAKAEIKQRIFKLIKYHIFMKE